jgi:23S rRNA (uracil1939-C5)-methyltransferase
MDATRFMKDARRYKQHFDVIILDPPRAGTTQTFISSACALKPKKVLYISFDPKTLMLDLNGFRKEGYAIQQMQCVDMFPYTQHVETVVLMSRVEGK